MQPEVKSAACYMEAVRDAEGLRRVGALSARLGKPVFVMKSGFSEPGIRAAAAHTGALATSDVMCSAAFEQWGLIRARTFDELISAAAALPRISAKRRAAFRGLCARRRPGGCRLRSVCGRRPFAGRDRLRHRRQAEGADAGHHPGESLRFRWSVPEFRCRGADPGIDRVRRDPAITSVVYMLMPVAVPGWPSTQKASSTRPVTRRSRRSSCNTGRARFPRNPRIVSSGPGSCCLIRPRRASPRCGCGLAPPCVHQG